MCMITRYKLVLIMIIMLLMILNVFNLAFAIREQLSQISSNLWTLLIKDLSDQIIETNKNHSSLMISISQFIKHSLCKLKALSSRYLKPILSLHSVENINVKIIILFFSIYYQLARTSFENSDPYIFNKNNL